jgi:hypothetical protein
MLTFCHGSIAARLLLFRGEFCTADFSYFGQISSHEFPNDRRSDVFVVVTQYVANASYFLPRDCRVPRFQLVCEMSAGLRNNLNAPLNQPLSLPIVFERFERHIPQHAMNAIDRLYDVRQTGN